MATIQPTNPDDWECGAHSKIRIEKPPPSDPGPRPGTYRDGATFRGQPIDWMKGADDEDDGTLEGPGVLRNA